MLRQKVKTVGRVSNFHLILESCPRVSSPSHAIPSHFTLGGVQREVLWKVVHCSSVANSHLMASRGTPGGGGGAQIFSESLTLSFSLSLSLTHTDTHTAIAGHWMSNKDFQGQTISKRQSAVERIQFNRESIWPLYKPQAHS